MASTRTFIDAKCREEPRRVGLGVRQRIRPSMPGEIRPGGPMPRAHLPGLPRRHGEGEGPFDGGRRGTLPMHDPRGQGRCGVSLLRVGPSLWSGGSLRPQSPLDLSLPKHTDSSSLQQVSSLQNASSAQVG